MPILPMLLAMMQTNSTDVVVTARHLADARQTCAQGGCSPLRDAQVAIALAEQQFRDGEYLKAKKTLADTIGRTKHSASVAPRPIAALYEAYATVAIHDGDEEGYRRAVGAQVRTLQDNLPATDPAVTSAAFAMGEMFVKIRRYPEAEQAYAGVERRATAAGQDGIALIATLRRVAVLDASGNDGKARQLLAAIDQRPIARDPAYAAAIRVMHLRMAARNANDAEMNQLVTAIGHGAGTRPALVWAPSYEPTARAAASDDSRKFGYVDPGAAQSIENEPLRWADIGFWIRPDGHTDDIAVLRASLARGWTEPMLKQIAGRRYTGTTDQSPAQGVYIVERFTERPSYVTPKGSLIPRRAGPGRLQVLELTQSPAKAPGVGG